MILQSRLWTGTSHYVTLGVRWFHLSAVEMPPCVLKRKKSWWWWNSCEVASVSRAYNWNRADSASKVAHYWNENIYLKNRAAYWNISLNISKPLLFIFRALGLSFYTARIAFGFSTLYSQPFIKRMYFECIDFIINKLKLTQIANSILN